MKHCRVKNKKFIKKSYFYILLCFFCLNLYPNNIENLIIKDCKQCHKKQFENWYISDHFKAMAKADNKSVLGNFNNQTISFHNIRNRLFIKNKQYFINTLNENKKYQDYKISYTFGHYPLQQYLIETKKGHLQALNIAWDSREKSEGGQRWFHLQKEINGTKDIFFWTRHFQNANSRCIQCHTTNYSKNYNRETKTYNSSWSDINISCEACHIDVKKHLSLAKKNKFSNFQKDSLSHTVKKATWIFKKDKNSAIIANPNFNILQNQKNIINICGTCHSRRENISKFKTNEDFYDNFKLKMLEKNLYEIDGQILDEVFVLGSFLQSKMYKKGVSCTNCHEPHSQKLYFEGNNLCLQCHKKNIFDVKTHHNHKKNSIGSKCINCHMPQKKYMGVDFRADHSFSIPRPDLSILYNTSNACTNCHKNKSNLWAKKSLKNFLKKQNKNLSNKKDTYTKINKMLQNNNFSALNYFLTEEINSLAKIQIATLYEQLKKFPINNTYNILSKDLKNKNILIKLSAISALEYAPPKIKISLLFPLKDDKNLSVRNKITQVLSSSFDFMNKEQKQIFKKLTKELIKTLEYNSDSPIYLTNLANLYINLKNFNQAKKLLKEALEIEANYLPANLNLADIYRIQGLEKKVFNTLKKTLTFAKDYSIVYYSIALHYLRINKVSQAIKYLKISISKKDANALNFYVYALALLKNNQIEKAKEILTKSLEKWPKAQNNLILLKKLQMK